MLGNTVACAAGSCGVTRGCTTERVFVSTSSHILKLVTRPAHTVLYIPDPDALSATWVQDNTYWLGLMTHLQAESVPMKSVECLRDLKLMNEAATIDDIYDAYSQVRGNPTKYHIIRTWFLRMFKIRAC